MTLVRRLGRSEIEVSALGLGCWAIGGPWTFVDHAAGWGQIDDDESIRAIHCALDLGINFFDTAANYGCGHSERLLGEAVASRRDKVILATKFGYVVDEEKRIVTLSSDVVSQIRQACEASLRRLNTDYIDLYQFHVGDYDPAQSVQVRDVLEGLVAEGKIRWYGWSTDNAEGARLFAQGRHCTTIQHILNVARDAPEILAICAELDQASVNRTPLGGGMLLGKFTPDTTFPEDDVRHGWNLKEGWGENRLQQIEAAREILTSNGRTLAQAALAWIWARSDRTIPIPGFKTVAQVKENVKAMEFGPFTSEQVRQINALFGRA